MMTRTAIRSEIAHQRPLQPVPGRRYAKAKRMINTQGMDRDTWLSLRKTGIGSSDAAAAVGLSPYKSQLELWMEKTSRIDTNDAALRDPTQESAAYWGTTLEPIVAEHYARRTGQNVRRVNAILQHPDHPWMLANVDREIVGSPDVQLLECKTTGYHGAKRWEDGIPDDIKIQVLHQLAVTGQQAADVAVLIAGQAMEIHRIEAIPSAIANLIDLERTFWDYVESDTPPPADGSKSSERALQSLYPQDHGQTVDFTQDEAMSEIFDALKGVRIQIDQASKKKANLENSIKSAMGNASYAKFLNGSISWKRAKSSQQFDASSFKTVHPDLHAQFLLEQPGSRRFLVRD